MSPDAENRALPLIRALVELVYQPSEGRLSAVVSNDWREFPRIHHPLDALDPTPTVEAVVAVVRTILREAREELRPRFPNDENRVSTYDVFFWHVVDQQPWPSMETMLVEQGRPCSRTTLIKRQHDFLPHLMTWARNREVILEQGDANEAGAVRTARSSFRLRVTVVGGLVIIMAVVLGLVLRISPAAKDGVELSTIPSHRLGKFERDLVNKVKFDPVWSRFELPPLDPAPDVGMILELEPGRFTLLLSNSTRDREEAVIYHWDPVSAAMLWESSLDPPGELRLTHAGVGSEVLNETYWVDSIYYAGVDGDLGDQFAAVLLQRYSPTFVAFIQIDTGVLNGYYVHPGYLQIGTVIDIDGDGEMEVVLGGQDNAVDRAVLLALTPRAGITAASTVDWNRKVSEGADLRVLMPEAELACEYLEAKRLVCVDLDQSYFNRATRVMDVGVGLWDETLFHARIMMASGSAMQPKIVLWDRDEVALDSHGIPRHLIRDWESDFISIRGGARWQQPLQRAKAEEGSRRSTLQGSNPDRQAIADDELISGTAEPTSTLGQESAVPRDANYRRRRE